MEEEIFNGESKDEVHQKGVVIQDGMEGQLADESWRMMNSVDAEESFEAAVSENGVENGKKGDGLASSSSSSSDEETEVVLMEKTDDDTGVISTVNYEDEEKGDLDLIVEEEQAAEIDSIQLNELKNVAELVEETVEDEETVYEADISTEHEENGLAEEEIEEVIITVESPSPISEAVAVELVDVVDENGVQEQDRIKDAEEVWSTVVGEIEAQSADQVAAVEEVLLSTTVETREAEFTNKEGTTGTLQYGNGEDSVLTVAKSSNGTDESNKTELPESNGNPHIISISTRTVRPTSWKGCCGLLEVFRRGDR